MYHLPVMLKTSVDALNIREDGVYVDCTFGGGGHSREILSRLGENGKLYSFDRDLDAQRNSIDDPRFTFVRGNFKYISNFMRYYGHAQVDGVLADFGVSSHHFDEAERGFSYRFDGKLDMRMNQKSELTAEIVLNTYSEEKLADIFYNYGEIRQSRRIATAICQKRAERPIKTIFQLVEILKPFCTRGRENKELAPTFQALRIEVNDELEAIERLLESSVELLKPAGRIVLISYHSLEDRLVKRFFKTGNLEGEIHKDFYGNLINPLKNINPKVIVSDSYELEDNSRARSARLRIAEKL